MSSIAPTATRAPSSRTEPSATLMQLVRLLGRDAARDHLRRKSLGVGTDALPITISAIAGLAVAVYFAFLFIRSL